MIHPVPTHLLHTVVVRYLDGDRRQREASFSDWSLRDATYRAWRFIRPKRMAGEALCFRFLNKTENRL